MPDLLADLAAVAAPFRDELERADAAWADCPLDWVRRLPSPKRRGTLGERILSAYLVEHGIAVERTPDVEADRLVGGRRMEIKTAFRSGAGTYTFMQVRPAHDYTDLLLFGISPDTAHLWIVPKHVALPHTRPQHGGASGSGETRLLVIRAAAPPDWLSAWGGELDDAVARLALGAPPSH